MWNKNLGQIPDEIQQNRFTAYVTIAVQRRKKDYMSQLKKYRDTMCTLEEADLQETAQTEDMAGEGLPVLMRLQNESLLQALLTLGEREKYVVLNCALEKKTFAELSLELGLSYKGVAAIYYRAIQKVRKRMGGISE